MKCPKCKADVSEDSHFCSKCGTPVKDKADLSVSQTKTIQKPTNTSGMSIAGKYKIIEEIGRGGMGVVYKAEDIKLKRTVALKFLPPELNQDKEAKQRFIQEAQAAAALNHPHICTIHEVDEADGQTFISMEYIEGKTLKERLASGPIHIHEAIDIATQVALGLQKAHKKGIIHRDIKPANIMINEDGQAKISDFGLAKLSGMADLTKASTIMGTVAYMSPEQAKGEAVDHRTDIWSLGVVIYELLSGKLPFESERETSIMYSIVHEKPKPIEDRGPHIPIELQQIITSTLEKNLNSRYQSIEAVLKDIRKYKEIIEGDQAEIINIRSFIRSVRRPLYAIPILLIFIAVSFFSFYLINRKTKIRWARNEAVPEMVRLISEDSIKEAYILGERVEKYIPTDPQLVSLWPQISTVVSAQTIPPGANIYMRDYDAIDEEWLLLGLSPLEDVRVSVGYKRWKIEKNGYGTVELAGDSSFLQRKLELREKDRIPSDMVEVPNFTITENIQGYLTGSNPIESIGLRNFLIDRYEVTNKQFKEFLKSGGYQNKEYWEHELSKNGQALSWDEAMDEFRDATGRPGPSTWELGSYPEGEADFPVRGISWYEAAAFAEYAEKSLPTIYHWYLAAGIRASSNITPLSNFGNEGPTIVGNSDAINPFGSYDMAGNVREWCFNESRGLRYILGGAWNEPSYLFHYPIVKSHLDRSPTNGFRCVRYLDDAGASPNAARPVELIVRDYYMEKPVDEALFQVYKQQFNYDHTELNAAVESTDSSSEYWRIEKVTFDAAYDKSRMLAYIYLPKQGTPPYQTIVYFPGSSAIQSKTHVMSSRTEFILKSNRAVVCPIYKGTQERNDGLTSTWPNTSHRYAEYLIKWVKDLKRSIDYLETRSDIDINRLAFVGFSWGGRMGAIIPAVEDRFRVSVLFVGGLASGRARPEVDQINYITRVTIPTLMLNGKYDSIEPYRTAQLPMYQLLGTPDENKKHIPYETDHGVPRNAAIKETLKWLDRYLGPVK